MSHIYLIIDENKYPVVWRVHEVQGSIRLFEDGLVAEQFRLLAIKLGYGDDIELLRLDGVVAAKEYVEAVVFEPIWYHIYTLPFGYNDKYAYNKK